MEIEPVPHRATRGEWRRLALGLLVLTPVVLLVLLPAVLGLDRFVVTERAMDGALGRGSVVLARQVPRDDVKVDDVIFVRPPGAASDERVPRRITAIDGDVATVRADRPASAKPWQTKLGDDQPYDRAWLGIPWIGYPFVLDGGWLLLAALAAAALLVTLVAGRRPQQGVVKASPTRLPVG